MLIGILTNTTLEMDTATAIFTPKDGDTTQSLTGQFNFTQITSTKVHFSEGFIKNNEGWNINSNGGTSVLQSDFEGISVNGTYGI
ncbi:15245_t:CDS:2, partial [Racocetra fulgida]